jgi:hypothetical protein
LFTFYLLDPDSEARLVWKPYLKKN